MEDVNAKWDYALDLIIRRAVYGTLAGGAAALVLLSKFATKAIGAPCTAI